MRRTLDLKVGYENFRVVLAWALGRNFWVHVSASAAGQGYGRVKVPRDAEHWGAIRADLRQACREAQEEDPSATRVLSLKQTGHEIFRALLPKELADIFAQSKVIASRTRSRLRLQIRFRGKTSALALLHGIPWELLYEENRGFLCMDQFISLVRQIEVGQPAPPRKMPAKPHVLIVSSNPTSQSLLNLKAEQEAIENAWKNTGAGTIRVLEAATVSALSRTLCEKPVNILHYMGHADRDGRVLFEDEGGSPDRVSPEALSRLVAHRDSLCFVFLNACSTAGSRVAVAPFASMGPAISLISAGVPTVLAMQFQIPDEAAVAFGGAVHENMASGKSIEVAVLEGRNLLASRWRESPEWATPVLFEQEHSRQAFEAAILQGGNALDIAGRWKAEIEYLDCRQGKEKAQSLDRLTNKFIMDIRYNEGRWVGEAECYEGYSVGNIYDLDGVLENNIFSCTWRVGNKSALERGALVLTLKERQSGLYLQGCTTYWEAFVDEVMSTPCEWSRCDQ